jgi:MFS family permease
LLSSLCLLVCLRLEEWLALSPQESPQTLSSINEEISLLSSSLSSCSQLCSLSLSSLNKKLLSRSSTPPSSPIFLPALLSCLSLCLLLLSPYHYLSLVPDILLRSLLPSQGLLLSLCLFLIGMGVNGPKTLLGVSVRESVPSSAIGLAGGILGIIGQLGGAAAGAVLGSALQTHGWGIYLFLLFVSAAACAVLILLFLLLSPTPLTHNSSGPTDTRSHKDQ